MYCGIGGLSGAIGPDWFYAPGAPRPEMKRAPQGKNRTTVPTTIPVPTTPGDSSWHRRVRRVSAWRVS